MKKGPSTKSVEERLLELAPVYGKLRELGISMKLQGMDEFARIANEFLRDGTSASGILQVPRIGRILHYKLSNRPSVKSEVILKAASGSAATETETETETS